ncbi:MAG: hypothetical protein N2Z70_00675 [Bdellovibrionaceae bacterium]|nr:hypothetical protein [Pseudobdellovibrionaceae bacterium]
MSMSKLLRLTALVPLFIITFRPLAWGSSFIPDSSQLPQEVNEAIHLEVTEQCGLAANQELYEVGYKKQITSIDQDLVVIRHQVSVSTSPEGRPDAFIIVNQLTSKNFVSSSEAGFWELEEIFCQ